jgi:hypothetical protein
VGWPKLSKGPHLTTAVQDVVLFCFPCFIISLFVSSPSRSLLVPNWSLLILTFGVEFGYQRFGGTYRLHLQDNVMLPKFRRNLLPSSQLLFFTIIIQNLSILSFPRLWLSFVYVSRYVACLHCISMFLFSRLSLRRSLMAFRSEHWRLVAGTPASYSGGHGFKSRTGDRLTRLSVVFLCPPGENTDVVP